MPVAAPIAVAVDAPAKLTVVAVALKTFAVVAAVPRVNVPVPILMVVAAPPKLIVVAVVLTSANVVDDAVMGDTTEMPAANGTIAVAVCVPSFSRHVERPVERSDHVDCAAVLEIVVPVTGEGAKLFDVIL